MTEIPPFEPKNLQVGDRYWEGRFPNGTGWTVLWVHEKGVLVQIGEDAEPTFLAYRYQFADGIARVKRGGVQIYPPPECPFKSGDEIHVHNKPKHTMTVTRCDWQPPKWMVSGVPHWTDATDWYSSPADLWELVPPAPAWTPHRGEFATDGTRDLFILRTDVKSNGSFSVQVFDLTYGEIDHFKPRDLKPLDPPVDELADLIAGTTSSRVSWDEAHAAAKTICELHTIIILRRAT